MEVRPKIKIDLTHFDKLLEISGISLLIILWILTAYNYFQSPDTVAIHFNLSGKPDGYGSKETLLLIPIIPTIIYLGLTKLNKYPHIYNYTTKITAENAKRQYTIATRMIRILKVSVVLIFTIVILSTLLITAERFNGLGIWFLPFIISILIVPSIYAIIQSQKKIKKTV